MSTSPTSSSLDEKKKKQLAVRPEDRETIAPVGGVKEERLIEDGPDDEDSSLNVQISERSMSWPRTAVLLFTEYVVLAILAFPSSFAILGMAGGVICTIVVGLSVLYTSHVLWRFCMAYPQCRDIADVAYWIFGEHRWAWYAAFTGLALNNLFIMGLHANAGATAINTLGFTTCTTVWGVVLVVIMWAGSLLRDMRHTTILGIFSAGTMFICFLIVVIGHGVQGTPNGYVSAAEATAATPETSLAWTVWAPEGTTWTSGMSAMLNIAYTFIGQALIPSFVGEMHTPEDFPKALYLSMAAELLLFTICGAVVYAYVGTELTTAPAYGSLIAKYGRPAAAFTLPTIIVVGVLYSLVTSRALFFQFFDEKSPHRRTHTVKGWAIWTAIVTGGWIIAFVIGESIPFFNDLLSLISSLFDSWFGYVFWAFAYRLLYKGRYFESKLRGAETIINVVLLFVGFYIFGAGTAASILSIKNSYATGSIKTPFSCVNSGFLFTR